MPKAAKRRLSAKPVDRPVASATPCSTGSSPGGVCAVLIPRSYSRRPAANRIPRGEAAHSTAGDAGAHETVAAADDRSIPCGCSNEATPMMRRISWIPLAALAWLSCATDGSPVPSDGFPAPGDEEVVQAHVREVRFVSAAPDGFEHVGNLYVPEW